MKHRQRRVATCRIRIKSLTHLLVVTDTSAVHYHDLSRRPTMRRSTAFRCRSATPNRPSSTLFCAVSRPPPARTTQEYGTRWRKQIVVISSSRPQAIVSAGAVSPSCCLLWMPHGRLRAALGDSANCGHQRCSWRRGSASRPAPVSSKFTYTAHRRQQDGSRWHSASRTRGSGRGNDGVR